MWWWNLAQVGGFWRNMENFVRRLRQQKGFFSDFHGDGTPLELCGLKGVQTLGASSALIIVTSPEFCSAS